MATYVRADLVAVKKGIRQVTDALFSNRVQEDREHILALERLPFAVLILQMRSSSKSKDRQILAGLSFNPSPDDCSLTSRTLRTLADKHATNAGLS